ncbi:hypothetical protein Tco_1429529 [Tanacetum coccineum]
MDLLSFIQTADPTQVRVGESQRAEDEPRLLDTTVGCVVPMLPIALARAESELDASVDKLFDEGGSGNQAEQGDSASGGHGVGIQLVSKAAKTDVDDAAPVQPRRQRKRKIIISDAGGPSHPLKKLRQDHKTLSGASIGGKSRCAVQRLLAGAVQNVEVKGEPIPTLPFVTSSVFATSECEDEAHTDSATGLNLRTIGALPRFVISSDSSHHFGANIAEAEVDSFARPSVPLMTVATTVTSTVDPSTTVKEKFVGSYVFGGGSSFASGADYTVGGFSNLTSSDFIVGGIRIVINPDTDLQKREKEIEFCCGGEKNSLLKARDKELESLKVQLLVKKAEAAEAIRLRAEASKFEVVERSLRDEVKVLKEQNAALKQERTDLGVKVADFAASVKVREQEVVDLDAQVTFTKSQSDNLADRVHELETSSAGLQEKVTAYDNFIDQLKKFQDEKMQEVNKKFDKLCVDFVEMALHLEEKFYPHLLTTIFGHRWLLTHGMNLALAKCLNSTEYLYTLGAAIGKAVKKGMQEGLSAGITHGAEGRKLTDVAAYNPYEEADYLSALQRLQSVNFYLIAKLRSNKDASVDRIMNLFRLEDTLAKKLGLTESQPHVNQLMVPIHHSSDQRVIGASALSLSLDVSSSRVWKIKENIANYVSALRDVFVPLSKPLSAVAVGGMEGTSGAAPDTITTLSVTFVSASIIPPISTDDYEVADGQGSAGADGGAVVDKNVNPFP